MWDINLPAVGQGGPRDSPDTGYCNGETLFLKTFWSSIAGTDLETSSPLARRRCYAGSWGSKTINDHTQL